MTDALVQWINTPRFANSPPPQREIVVAILDLAHTDSIRSHTVREEWTGYRYQEICIDKTAIPSRSPKDEFWDIDMWFSVSDVEYFVRVNYSKPNPDFCFIYARPVVRTGDPASAANPDGGMLVDLTELKKDFVTGPIIRALTYPAEK